MCYIIITFKVEKRGESMKKIKLEIAICSLVMLLSGGIIVNGASQATGGYANLARNQSITYTMNNALYNYYFGSAKANVTPASNTYLTWKMKSGNTTLKELYINALNTSSYSHTSIFTYGPGTYNHQFIAGNSSFEGSVQTTNTDKPYIGFSLEEVE